MSFKKTLARIVLVGALAVEGLSGKVKADNLLTNPSFETGDLSGWIVNGDAQRGVVLDGTPFFSWIIQPEAVYSRSGDYALYTKLENWGPFENQHQPPICTFSQNVRVNRNVTYDVGYYTLTGSPGDYGQDSSNESIIIGGIETKINAGTPIGHSPEDFVHNHIYYTPNADKDILVTFKIDSPYPAWYWDYDVIHSYDDFHFSIVPEPLTIGLLSLGSLVLLRKRKNS